MKIFMNAFWGETTVSDRDGKRHNKGMIMFPMVLLTIATIVLGIGAEAINEYM